MNGFGAREFQLVLLRRMADFNPALVERALAGMGADRADLRRAHRRWTEMDHSRTAPQGLLRHKLVLGRPDETAAHRFGDTTCETSRWRLPLWPGLRFEVLTAPDGATVLHRWLVRPRESPPPSLSTVADLTPWSCVVSDVATRFAPVSQHEGETPDRWHLTFTAEARDHRATFSYGLLQTTEPFF